MSTTGPAGPEPDADVHTLLGPASDGLAAALARWAADARVEEAGAARSRERWLRQQAVEEATTAGVLCDLAERGVPVVIGMSSGRQLRGIVSAVGADFVVLRSDGRDVLVAADAVEVVRPQPGVVAPVGDRNVDVQMRLIDALSYLAAERPRILLVTRSGERVAGRLRALGRDLVSIDLDGEARAVAYVPVSAVVEIGVV